MRHASGHVWIQSPRQQSLIVVGGVRVRQTFEQRDEVLVRLNAVGFAGLHERIQVSGGVCAGDGVTEEPAPASNRERSDRVLTRVMPTPRICRVVHMRGGGCGLS